MPIAGGIFRDQGLNLCLLHWQADSYPLYHWGSPCSISFLKSSFSCSFIWNKFLVFSFSLSFFISMKLGEPVSYFDLEAVSFCGSNLIRSVCSQWLWWETGSDISMNHVFPQGLLAAITLVGGGARDRGLEQSPPESGLLCSMPTPPYCVWAPPQMLEQQLPGVGVWAGSIPSKGVLPTQHPSPGGEGMLQAAGVGRGLGCGTPGPSRSSAQLHLCCLHKCWQWPPRPPSDGMLGLCWLRSHNCTLPSAAAAPLHLGDLPEGKNG